MELEHSGEFSKWVKENVIPHLNDDKIKRSKAIKKIKNFIGDEKPYPVCFVNIYDMVYIYSFFGSIKETPFHWPPIDFASMLFASGIDPESYYTDDKNNFFEEIGIDASNFSEHNALDDAKLLREVYLKLVK